MQQQFVHEVFLLMLNLAQMENQEQTIRLFLEAMNAAQSHTTLRLLQNEDQASEEIVEIATARQHFGRIACQPRSETPEPEAEALIRNAVRMLTIVLENQRLRRLLENQNQRLERRVQKRTATLQESKNRYQRLLETLQEGIWAIDAQAQTTFVNAHMAEMLGYRPEDMLGRHLFSFMPEDQRDRAARLLKRRKQGIDEHHEFTFLHKEGFPIPTLVNTSPILESDGTYKGAIASMQNLTRRKQTELALRQERDLVTRLMETSPVCITTLDRDGNIVFANAYAEEVLGLTEDEVTERMYNDPAWRITDYHGQPVPEEELPFQQVLETKEPVRDVRHAIEWPDGQRKMLSINGAPLFDTSGKIEGAVFAIEDITERVDAAEELEQHRKHLEEMVERRTARLQIMLDAMTGREVRMAELKNVIRRLRSQMKEAGLQPVADDPLMETSK